VARRPTRGASGGRSIRQRDAEVHPERGLECAADLQFDPVVENDTDSVSPVSDYAANVGAVHGDPSVNPEDAKPARDLDDVAKGHIRLNARVDCYHPRHVPLRVNGDDVGRANYVDTGAVPNGEATIGKKAESTRGERSPSGVG